MRRGVAVILLLGLVSCTAESEQSNKSAVPSQSTVVPATDLGDLQALMDRYFAALSSGDIDAAMRERCSEAQIGEADYPLLARQVATLLDESGATGIVVFAPTSEAPAEGGANFDFALSTAVGESQRVHARATYERGGWRLCDVAQITSPEVEAALSSPPPHGDDFLGSAHDLLPDDVPEGYEVEVDKPLDNPGTDPAWVSTALRTWTHDPYGGVRLIVMEFDDAAAADRAAIAAIHQLLPQVTDTFAVEGLPNAVGVRNTADTWTLIQPAGVGPQCDQLFLSYGRVVAWLTTCGLQPDDDHQIVQAFAVAVDTTSRA